MAWTELLQKEIETTYAASAGLMEMVSDGELGWKPATGDNWMTMGQLLMHMTSACGWCCRGVATSDWSLPDGSDISEMTDEEMLPSAEKMPSVESVASARSLLDEDRQLALKTVADSGEDDLATKISTVPWDPSEMILGHRMLQMVGHLNNHKSQLFYYLKLQGKPVHTGSLYGMG